MTGILLTQSTAPIISQVAWLLGKIMDGIYIVMDRLFGVENIGICIILFTILIYFFMIPLTYRQQKFSRMSAVMNPELQKIQKKYANKKDQASMAKMQEETQNIYEKYGTSPTGGCAQLLIQFPILFALYAVIRGIPAYVSSVKDMYLPLVNELMNQDGYQKFMEKIGEKSPILIDPDKYDYTQADTLVGVLYKFQTSSWESLSNKFPDLADTINSTVSQISNVNNFLGISIAETPLNVVKSALETGAVGAMVIAVAIPVLSGITQIVNMKMTPNAASNSDDPTMKSMNSTMKMMPLLSVFMCFTLPAGLGIYWIASAVVRTIQMAFINRYLDRIPMEVMIERNREKAKKKREKKGTSGSKLSQIAQQSTRNIESEQEKTEKKSNGLKEKNKKFSSSSAISSEELKKTYERNSKAKPGSLAAKANMVREYNENKK